MKLTHTNGYIYCTFFFLLFCPMLLQAGDAFIDKEGVRAFTSERSLVSEYVANNAGCGAHNIFTLRAFVSGSGTIGLSGSATSGRDFTLLNPEYCVEGDKAIAQDFLFHIFDDAVLEEKETIVLTFEDGRRHTIEIADNESAVTVGNGTRLLSANWPFLQFSTPIASTSIVAEASLGPLETVYFMSHNGEGVVGKISNLSRHDFGCVTVESQPLDASDSDSPFLDCLPRLFSVEPSNPKPSADYQITWYLTDEELAEYASQNLPEEKQIRIFKDTNSSEGQRLIDQPTEISWIGGGKAITAIFTGGFGQFGIGFKAVDSKLYGYNQDQFQGTQLRPTSPYLHQFRNASARTSTTSIAGQKIVGQ